MDSKKRKVVLAVSASVAIGLGIVVMSGLGSTAFDRLGAQVPVYGIVFNGTNGAASVATLKTSSGTAKTVQNNNVNFDYKNMQPVSGKVGRILANGFYGNSNPINDMSKITVTSNAAADDAVLMWGATSGYLNHSIDLASAGDGVEVQGANFFKIVATNPVEVESISVEFGCSEKNYGGVGYDADGKPVANAYEFIFKNGTYGIEIGGSYASVVKAVIPDFYDDGENGLAPVTTLLVKGSSGLFEGNTTLEEVYLPNTVTTSENYLFYSSNHVIEYTLPLNMASGTSYAVPKGDLRVLNINARSYSTNTTSITASNQPNLERINVSYDVESLPAIVSSWPDNVTIYYEGTEAEWEELAVADADQWFTFSGDVICSDSVAATITFSYEGATLGGVVDSKTISTLVGKSIADPGKPSYNGAVKKFTGWFDAPSGGNKITFPHTVAGDETFYAQFEDLPAGSSIADPVMVTLGQSYTHEVFAEADTAYFEVVADHDLVFTATITSADNSFNDYIYLRGFNDDGTRITLSTGNSASTDCGNSPSLTTSSGVGNILKARLSSGDHFIVGVDGKAYSSTKYGEFTIKFDECVANDGRDYTTAKVFTGTFSDTVPQKGVLWAAFTPETTGDYFITNTCDKWCGAYIGTISNGSFTSTNVTSSSTTKAVIMHLEAGTTYYVGFTANSANTVPTFTISSEIAETYSKGSAKAVTVDGTDETIVHSSDFTERWYSFTLDNAGKVRLTSDKVIYDHNQTSSKPIFCLFDSSDNVISFGNGRTNKDKVYDLAAGTYFLKVTTNANTTFNLTPVGEEATVTVYANGPTAAATHSEIVDAGTSYVLANPTYTSGSYTYYTGFDGWYTDTEFNNQFTSGDTIAANTDIYAKLNGRFQSDLFNNLYDQFGEYINDIFLDGSTHMHFVEDSGEIISTNAGVNSSYSSMVIEFKKAATVSFDYFSTNEGGNYDYFAVYTKPTKTGTQTQVLKAAGSMADYTSKSIVVDAGNVIKFEYCKDSSGSSGIDMAKIKNLNMTGVETVTLSYNYNDGVTDNLDVEVIANQSITVPNNPTREGYRFDRWYTSTAYDTPFDFNAGITANTEIFAKWIEQITVKVYTDGPNGDYETRVMDKGATLILPNYNSNYYHGHDGWYTDPDFNNPITSGTQVNENMSVYAKLEGKFKNDVANEIDAAYPGMFSLVTLNGNSYQIVFDSTAGTFTSGNAGVGNSSCLMELTLAVDADVSFDYAVSSESGWDKFTFSANGTSVVDGVSGTVNSSVTTTRYAAGTKLRFVYSKDGSGDTGSDRVVISNLVVVAA